MSGNSPGETSPREQTLWTLGEPGQGTKKVTFHIAGERPEDYQLPSEWHIRAFTNAHRAVFANAVALEGQGDEYRQVMVRSSDGNGLTVRASQIQTFAIEDAALEVKPRLPVVYGSLTRHLWFVNRREDMPITIGYPVTIAEFWPTSVALESVHAYRRTSAAELNAVTQELVNGHNMNVLPLTHELPEGSSVILFPRRYQPGA